MGSAPRHTELITYLAFRTDGTRRIPTESPLDAGVDNSGRRA